MGGSKWGTDTQVWRRISPPFVPRAQDLELIRKALPPRLAAAGANARILVLGVTPALVAGPWPDNAELHAVDYDPAMIAAHWQPREGAHCHCARWQEMPFPDGHFDLVVGDCSFNALPRIADYPEVLREVTRVSRPEASLLVRFFVQPAPRLELASLPRDALGRFAAWSPLGRSLLVPIAAADADGSLRVADIPARVAEQWGELEPFLVAIGQPPEDRALLHEIYRFDQRLNFPTEARVRELLGAWYGDVSFAYPAYDCGELCPLVRCRR